MADGRSEDVPGEKWDRCVADTLLKSGVGLGIGALCSLVLFKRRTWPIVLGTGFGLGFAISNCQHDFKRVESLHMKPIKLTVKN
ncbi:PREDICTED: MICOS complex subunit Mic10-like [Amphimedon queenslandica]|uniref:MICOS complex subunit MIC10 n=1 Tax=Amphimedon queenslandica TaxID=400682 RepID=A0A1X7TUF2_AMPQE|nr:PREDICTED: MICOS complex subunit Mic10-like [Amphimedon queenslandica]|eukprot:XP_011406742.1 PREDICTED: MICOS complex subunit Mic10-like [Amphimedon queenslandica]